MNVVLITTFVKIALFIHKILVGRIDTCNVEVVLVTRKKHCYDNKPRITAALQKSLLQNQFKKQIYYKIF